MKLTEVAETAGMSTEPVRSILHEHLCMTKLYAIWVPRLLTLDPKIVERTINKSLQ